MAGQSESPNPTQTNQEVYKPSPLLKRISKQQSGEERSLVAGQIHNRRMEHFQAKKSAQGQKLQLGEQLAETEIDIDRQVQRIEDLDAQLSQLSGSWFNRIWNYFKIRSLNPQLTMEQAALQQLQQQQGDINLQHQAISEQFNQPSTPTQLEEARKMLQDFYQKEEQKWANTPYSRGDIQRYFTEQNLASLSLDDYILLLKRFPREMVTHVTRQGIRDHTGHSFHTKWVGEYHDGFIRILEDGRLRSPLAVYLKEGLKEEAIKDFMTKYLFNGTWPPTREYALQTLDHLTIPNQYEADHFFPYSDKMAIHVATEEVADGYYGSEGGNEIFLAFPSALIASQYFFYGQLTKPGDNAHNDQWVWANEERGMDINTGLVFIPEEARVDPKTGSRYKLDADHNPIVNQAYIDKIKELAGSAEFGELAKLVDDIVSHTGWTTYNIAHAEQLGWPPKAEQLFKGLEPIRQTLEQQFGITDRRLQTALLDYRHLSRFKADIHTPFVERIREILESQSILYIEAESTIPSKDFWENYFAVHPNQRPSKVIYYKGQDPTDALREWKISHGITKVSGVNDLEFREKYVRPNSPQATAGLSRFRSIAEEVIDKSFSLTTKTS